MTKTLIVDPELNAYLPPLDRETKAMLEESIKNAGKARQPIEIWKGKDVIIDGHNRYEICNRLSLPYAVSELDFKTRNEVKQHMLEVQVSRRNLTKEQASQFRGQYVKMLRGIRAKDIANGKPVDTTKTVAQQAAADTGVSEATVKRDAQFSKGLDTLAETVPVEAKKIAAGKSKVNKGTVENIGKATTEAARAVAVEDAVKQSTRTHRKEVTNRVTHLKPTVAEPKGTDAEKLAKTEVIIEKLAMFLSAKAVGGRRGMMKQIVKLMGEHEGSEYTVPAEYADEPVKSAPPALKGKAVMADD